MADELIDIYDENNNPLNKQILRSVAHKEGHWHRGVHIWIHNSKGEILLQKRSKDKLVFPNKWDIGVGGHIVAGDEPLQSAIQESKEELGIDFKETDLELIKIDKYSGKNFKSAPDNEFIYTFLGTYDGKISELTLQKEEVQDARFFRIDELREKMETNPDDFPPFKEYWKKMLLRIESTMDQSKSN